MQNIITALLQSSLWKVKFRSWCSSFGINQLCGVHISKRVKKKILKFFSKIYIQFNIHSRSMFKHFFDSLNFVNLPPSYDHLKDFVVSHSVCHHYIILMMLSHLPAKVSTEAEHHQIVQHKHFLIFIRILIFCHDRNIWSWTITDCLNNSFQKTCGFYYNYFAIQH